MEDINSTIPDQLFGGNRNAGFIRLMIAKHLMDRTPHSYTTPQRAKSTPSYFDYEKVQNPSYWLQQRMAEHEPPHLEITEEETQEARVPMIHKHREGEPQNELIMDLPFTTPEEQEPTMEVFKNMFDIFNHTEGERAETQANYDASHIIGDVAFLALMEKYKNASYLISKTDDNTGLLGLAIEVKIIAGVVPKIKLRWYYEEPMTKSFKDHFERLIKNKTAVIAIPLTFQVNTYNSKEQLDRRIGAHKNMIIYRPAIKAFEHFEPHGKVYGGGLGNIKFYGLTKTSYYEKLARYEKARATKKITEDQFKNKLFMLNEDFKKFNTKYNAVQTQLARELEDQLFFLIKTQLIVPDDAKWIPSADITPTEMGFQSIENAQQRRYDIKYEGFCQFWSLFYLELCLRFPKVQPRVILEKATEYLNSKGTRGFVDHILNYATALKNQINKYWDNEFSYINPTQNQRLTEWFNDFIERKYNELETSPIHGGRFVRV